MLQDTLELFQSWETLCQRQTVLASTIQHSFERMVEAYCEPHRTYHNLRHIKHVLSIVEWFDQQKNNPAEVQFAAWFHDVIYNPKASDNEERSADFAREILQELGLSVSTMNRVSELILLTKTHTPDPEDTDAGVLVDSDLAILGGTEAEYTAYATAIRSEYSWVCDEDFARGRTKVLRGFLAREKIFHTRRMFDILEEPARRNIEREIAWYS